MDSLPLVTACFTEAYSFRNCVDYLRHACTTGNLIFTPKNISFSRSDANGTVLSQLEIRISDITKYKYDACDENEQVLEEFAVGFNVSELAKATKSVGKKDGMYLYIPSGSNNIHIQTIGTSKGGGRSSVSYVPTLPDVQETIYDPIEYIRSEDEPNVRIPASDFARTCNSMATNKCQYVRIIGYPEGIIFKGMMAGHTVSQIDRYGICETRDTPPASNTSRIKVITPSEEIAVINVRTVPLIKAMAKFSNLTSSGIIKIYIEKDKPLKIISCVGNYGKLTVYLRNAIETDVN